VVPPATTSSLPVQAPFAKARFSSGAGGTLRQVLVTGLYATPLLVKSSQQTPSQARN